MGHKLTKEERQKGFRNAIFSIQLRYGLEFNEAVQWLLRKGVGLKWKEHNHHTKLLSKPPSKNPGGLPMKHDQ